MWRLTFSITTMASSTTRPVASVMPKSVRVLIENPMSLTKKKVPTRETGIVTAGISVLRQSCRKRNMVSTTKTMAMRSVSTTSQMDSLTTVVVSKATPYRSPGGKRFDRRSSSDAHLPLHLDGVGLGELHDADADRLVAAEAQGGVVVLGAQLGAAHVLEPHQRPVRARP